MKDELEKFDDAGLQEVIHAAKALLEHRSLERKKAALAEIRKLAAAVGMAAAGSAAWSTASAGRRALAWFHGRSFLKHRGVNMGNRESAAPLLPTITHDDACRLSRAFNMCGNLCMDQDYRINEWLKCLIKATYGDGAALGGGAENRSTGDASGTEHA